jgi:hypothetical protein
MTTLEIIYSTIALSLWGMALCVVGNILLFYLLDLFEFFLGRKARNKK